MEESPDRTQERGGTANETKKKRAPTGRDWSHGPWAQDKKQYIAVIRSTGYADFQFSGAAAADTGFGTNHQNANRGRSNGGKRAPKKLRIKCGHSLFFLMGQGLATRVEDLSGETAYLGRPVPDFERGNHSRLESSL